MTLPALVDAFHAHRSQDPNACVELGLETSLGDLPNPTEEANQERARAARQLSRQFKQLPSDSLDFEQGLDVELAQLLLDAEAFDEEYTFNDRSTRAQQPHAGDDIGNGIFLLSVADPRPAEDRLRDITSRIEAIPDYLKQAAAQLDTPVARWVDMDVEKVTELPTLFKSLEKWAEQEEFSDASRLKSAGSNAMLSLQQYQRQLRQLPTTDQFHVGPDNAGRLIALRGIAQSPDELHKMAKEFLHTTGQELEQLRIKLAHKYQLPSDASLAEVQKHLNQRFRVDIEGKELSHILKVYREEQEQLLSFIGQHKLFPVPEAQSLQILATPGFMQPSIPAGAMTAPAPFRDGEKTSTIFLTLSRELLDEHTKLTIPIMMVHEGIPGHHLQLATASQHPSTIRRHVMANDHAEGWTTLLEDYMLDRGYLTENVDEARFCAKRDLCRIGARVAIDLYFMTGQLDYLGVGVDSAVEKVRQETPASPRTPQAFAEAGYLLTAVTGFTPARAAAELNWYSQERAYPLSYLTGNRLAHALRRDVARQHPHSTSGEADRLFFDHYLSQGNMPLSFLRRSFAHHGLVSPRA